MVHKRQKPKISYWLEATRNAYGFGHDYWLFMSDGKKTKKFMLGQDVKVFSRALGMDMGYAIDHYSKKAKSKDFNKVSKFIATDILKTNAGRTQDDWDARLSQAELRNLFKAQAWEMSVQ